MTFRAIRTLLFRQAFVFASFLTMLVSSAAQTNGPDTVGAVLAGPYGALWISATGRRSSDAIAEYRKRLAWSEAANRNVSPEAYQALALALISNKNATAQDAAEAQRLLIRATRSGDAASQCRAHLILALVLAHHNHMDEAISALADASAPEEAMPLLRAVRAMLHSWRGNTTAASDVAPSTDGAIISYPMSTPPTPEWELVRVACYLIGSARYGRAWSPFDPDLLEYSVENGAMNRLAELSKEPSTDPEHMWSAIQSAFATFDAHDRSRQGLKQLLPYLLNHSFPDHRVDILAMLARMSLREGDEKQAGTYLDEAGEQLLTETADPMERVERQVKIAKVLEVPEDSSLAIKTYLLAYRTVLKLPESAKQLKLSFDIAHTLLRLYTDQDDIRNVAAVYKLALPGAIRLEESSELAKRGRFFRYRLQLDQIAALATIPPRRPEALKLLTGTLVPTLDHVMPMSSLPEEQLMDAMDAAKDPGAVPTIELYLQRMSSADIQEDAFLVLGDLYLHKEDWPAAERSLQQALDASLKRQGVCYPDQLGIWRDLALASQAAGHITDAKAPQQEWIDCSSVMNRNSEPLAEALTALAKSTARPTANGHAGDWFGAEYLFRRALHILSLQPTRRVRSLANAQLGLAALLLDNGRVHEGTSYTMQAAAELTAEPVTTPGYKIYAMETLRQLAQVREPAPALQEAAFALIQHGSTTHAAAALQAFSQRASLRDPRLAEAVQERLELQRQKQAVDREYDLDFATKSADINTERRQLLVQRLASLDIELGVSAGKLDAFPNYADLVSGRVVPLSTLTCQGTGCLLQSSESLIAFSQAPDALYAMVMRRGSAKLVRLELSELLATALIANVHRSVKLQTGVQVIPYDFASAAELYRRVWIPLRAELGTTDHVLIVADGPLGGLPLEVLAARQPAPDQPPVWLDDEVSLAYLPSVATLRALRVELRPSAAARPILVLGPPDMSAPLRVQTGVGSFDPFAAPPPGNPCALNLANLPPEVRQLSIHLAESMRGNMHRDFVEGSSMTKDALLSMNGTKDLATYRTIAFLTHGLMSGELSTESGIEPALVFTPPANCIAQQSQNPALLTASEVSGLSLDADLILLIACNTAASDGTPGVEPLSGMARAFFFAGARSLLVSHWSVDGTATARLLESAFGQEPAVSRIDQMRKARKQLRTGTSDGRSFAHPAFWGAFVTVGDGR